MRMLVSCGNHGELPVGSFLCGHGWLWLSLQGNLLIHFSLVIVDFNCIFLINGF